MTREASRSVWAAMNSFAYLPIANVVTGAISSFHSSPSQTMKFLVSTLLALVCTATPISASTFDGSTRSIANMRSLGFRVTPPPSEQHSRRRAGYSSSNRRSQSYLPFDTEDDIDCHAVQQCSASNTLGKNLVRGALLRVASDMSGGTPLESIKCRAATTNDNMVQAYNNIVSKNGFRGLWTGTPSRTVEGALLGALFMLGSAFTKKRILAMGGSPTMAALVAGTVGGIMQATVMTPAGMIFTSLNVNGGNPGYENDNAITVARRIFKEKGFKGMYSGGGPMCLRQATNWASRSCFTEIARTTFRMSQYGMLGEIGSGVIGGLGSCWNTPIETVRVLMQRDVSMGKKSKSFGTYWTEMVEEQGYPGLFRGVTPRSIQAIWQTVFMVVVPNMMGI